MRLLQFFLRNVSHKMRRKAGDLNGPYDDQGASLRLGTAVGRPLRKRGNAPLLDQEWQMSVRGIRATGRKDNFFDIQAPVREMEFGRRPFRLSRPAGNRLKSKTFKGTKIPYINKERVS